MIRIAIDGPAGAGKSTAAKLLAKELDINYMDTGAMYRAFAYGMIKLGIDVADKELVLANMQNVTVSVEYESLNQLVKVNGEDVTPFIRTPEISKGASDVALIPEVRVELVKTQRRTAEMYDIVMDGRDIGTYVLPDAGVKVYITASAQVRALRRQAELHTAGIVKPLEELIDEINSRDKADSEREFAPLCKAEDAMLLDTTDMDIAEVQTAIIKRIKEVYGDVL